MSKDFEKWYEENYIKLNKNYKSILKLDELLTQKEIVSMVGR